MKPELPRWALVLYPKTQDIGCLPIWDARQRVAEGRVVLIAIEDDELCLPDYRRVSERQSWHSNPRRRFGEEEQD